MSFLYTAFLFTIMMIIMPDFIEKHLTSRSYISFIFDVLVVLGLLWLMLYRHMLITRFVKPNITKTESLVDEIDGVKFDRPTLVETTIVKYPYWLLDPEYSYVVKIDYGNEKAP
jgi:hypothetical protein